MSRVTFGVPAYRAAAFIGETMQSIMAQEHRDFRVLVAVDSNDDATADICRTLGDSRVTIVEHSQNKGWLNNINWLYAQCETEFFNYVAHDDILHPAYLRVLLDLAGSKPEAVAIYPILRWFGKMGLEVRHEITGNRLERQKCQIQNQCWAPFLGMIRVEALRVAAPLRPAPYGNTYEDVVFTSRLALQGEMALAPYDLYGKRSHDSMVSSRFGTWDDATRRAAWKNVMGRILDTALLAAETRRERTELYLLAARSTVRSKPGAWSFFRMNKLSEEEKLVMASEFLDDYVQERGLDLEAEIDIDFINKPSFI